MIDNRPNMLDHETGPSGLSSQIYLSLRRSLSQRSQGFRLQSRAAASTLSDGRRRKLLLGSHGQRPAHLLPPLYFLLKDRISFFLLCLRLSYMSLDACVTEVAFPPVHGLVPVTARDVEQFGGVGSLHPLVNLWVTQVSCVLYMYSACLVIHVFRLFY